MHFPTSTLVILAAVLSPIFPLGINCRGATLCKRANGSDAKRLTEYINGIDQARHYSNGEHIACVRFGVGLGIKSHVCAFMQGKPEGASGMDILRLAHYIIEHGCRKCGSVPWNFPQANDIRNGQLTYNIVSSKTCDPDGLC